MLELSNAQIGAWVASFVLPLFRIAALLMFMPLLGSQLVSSRVRLYLAVAISLAIVPSLPPMPEIEALSLKTVFLIAQEILIGLMLGFTLQLLFQVFSIAGQIIATQMGLGFASMVDPTNGVSVPVIGQVFTILVNLLFLAMNAHLVVFEVITESFFTLPVGSGFQVDSYWQLAHKLSWVLAAALLLVLPAVTALLVINLAFGIMTRAAPQLNIFSIGFPLTLVLGFIIVWVSMADLISQYQLFASETLQLMRDLVQAR
ncbi:flagellar biosynthetic protein FliR [Pseudomonas sp. 5P_3.1_Bac2]|uniref:flagellar biosynthetic protein FliR n=1 Tax=Pseudomonas sp. 5P_3.1_Bac2 TaxID=2971617 RepID=UPI0021CAD663|nr:flagellar biosynthetic protein FliR [Pseudomonas sp. 5P_3.1_Bac2]MCU1715958.1 flagellar biosynthetic protein FliR [Pseudomonas sp. 5P_3.1_Bac2]